MPKNTEENNKEPKKGFPYGGFFIQYATQNLCMIRVLNNYLFSGKPLAHGFPKLIIIIIISKIDITKEWDLPLCASNRWISKNEKKNNLVKKKSNQEWDDMEWRRIWKQ